MEIVYEILNLSLILKTYRYNYNIFTANNFFIWHQGIFYNNDCTVHDNMEGYSQNRCNPKAI